MDRRISNLWCMDSMWTTRAHKRTCTAGELSQATSVLPVLSVVSAGARSERCAGIQKNAALPSGSHGTAAWKNMFRRVERESVLQGAGAACGCTRGMPKQHKHAGKNHCTLA
eukprot:365817-Chlamydomonas_euryale.AAC.39